MTEQHFHHDDPIDPKQWRTFTDEQRHTLIDQLFIAHYRILPIFEEFERAAWHSREPQMRMPYCIALLGEWGVRKTAIVRRWINLARTQQAESLEEVQVPYLYASLPVHPSYKGLLAGWLATFHDPSWKVGITVSMEERVRYYIKACHVQLLCIDHLEHLVLQESERFLHTFLDLLVRLITTTEISAVFIGRSETVGALLRGSSRMKNFIEVFRFLRPFKWDRQQPATVREFCFLLRAIDQALPLDPAWMMRTWPTVFFM